MNSQPPKRLKLFFWLLLGALSTFFAEVVAGSDPFPYFHPWGILLVCPLYTLHILVLASIVFRYGKPRFSTLFIAGAIFGLYEAYITKVIWSPTWGDPMIPVAEIALVEAMVLVLFWHPFLAFIIPLLVGECLLTSSREILDRLPGVFRFVFSSKTMSSLLLAALAVLFSITHSANAASPLHSLASGLSTTAFLAVWIGVWRKVTIGWQYDMRALLPGRRALTVLSVLLALLYLVTGILMRPEALPGVTGHALVLLTYVGFILLLVRGLRKSREEVPPEPVNSPVQFSWKMYLVLALLFTLSSTIANLAMVVLSGVVFLTVWFVGIGIGVVTLLRSVKRIAVSR
jgi:hypothetical protein